MTVTAKELFKKLRYDAQFSDRPAGAAGPIMTFGSQHKSDFESGKHKGRFAHLTNEYIDGLTDEQVETEMVSFIMRCFQQR